MRNFQIPEPKWVTEKPSEQYQYCPKLVDHENWQCAKRRERVRNFYLPKFGLRSTFFWVTFELLVRLYLQAEEKKVQSQVQKVKERLLLEGRYQNAELSGRQRTRNSQTGSNRGPTIFSLAKESLLWTARVARKMDMLWVKTTRVKVIFRKWPFSELQLPKVYTVLLTHKLSQILPRTWKLIT